MHSYFALFADLPEKIPEIVGFGGYFFDFRGSLEAFKR